MDGQIIIEYNSGYSSVGLANTIKCLLDNNCSESLLTDVFIHYFLHGIKARGMPDGYWVEYLEDVVSNTYRIDTSYFFTKFKESIQ